MKTTALGLFLVLVLAAASGDAERDPSKPAQDVEVSGIMVDGLGRPLPGATIEFFYREGPRHKGKNVPLATFATDDSGRYAGTIHNWPDSAEVMSWVSKPGHWGSGPYGSGSSGSDLSFLKNQRFTLRQAMTFEEATRDLFTLQGGELDQRVLEILASNLRILSPVGGSAPNIEDVLFEGQAHFLAPLHKACANPYVGDNARVFLEFLGELRDPNELQSMKRGTPTIDVSARRLNDAVQAVAEAYRLLWGGQEEIYIDKTVFTSNYGMALVRCHVHHGYLADRGYKLRFERVGDKWVLKAFVFEWLS
jgi:hypothetical protein